MLPPTTTITAASASAHTTIPVSPADVISRSLHNLSTAISRLRPWPELIASGLFRRPDSISSALARLHSNFQYFRINYTIIISACEALSLIGSPVSLLLLAFIYALWLLLYFFREDPLMVWGWDVSDRMMLVGLLLVSLVWGWVSGGVGSLAVGIVVGVVGCGIHAVLRNAEDGAFVHAQEPLMGSASESVGSYGSTDAATGLTK